MANNYIWTNHAIQRLKERKIPRKLIDQALYSPDKKLHKNASVTEQQKRIDGVTFAVIIKENEKGEKIIVSCWVNPPFPGTKDHRLRQRFFAMKKASFMKKLWLTLLTQLGL
ncbi:MAG TPA: DUF4258 domain-containing protein [Candidatus Saccharimonadales bacterium]|nr:DUF4258 domain-containing protein [Candidatus Saccharimonadales bacterium]